MWILLQPCAGIVWEGESGRKFEIWIKSGKEIMDKAFAGIRNCRVKILKFLVEISRWKMKNYVSDNGFCIIILNFEKDVLENDIRKWIKFVNVKNERKSYVGKALHTMFGLRPWGGKNWFKIALTGIVWRIALVGIVLKLVIAKRRLFEILKIKFWIDFKKRNYFFFDFWNAITVFC